MNTWNLSKNIKEIKEVLITEDQMKKRIEELGAEISRDFYDKDLVIIGVLKGSIVFLADLIRKISIPMTLDFISVSSYGESAFSSGVITLKKDIEIDVIDKNILIVEDIADTGLTLKYLKDLFIARGAKSVTLCVALNKPSRRRKDIDLEIKYVGFEIPDKFVVGYGLDYAEKYRNLSDVCVLTEEIYGKN